MQTLREAAISLQDALIDRDDADDVNGNVRHIAEHDLTPDEVESALRNPAASHDASHFSGLPCLFAHTHTGRFMVVVYDVLNADDPTIIHPVTAYEVPEPQE